MSKNYKHFKKFQPQVRNIQQKRQCLHTKMANIYKSM